MNHPNSNSPNPNPEDELDSRSFNADIVGFNLGAQQRQKLVVKFPENDVDVKRVASSVATLKSVLQGIDFLSLEIKDGKPELILEGTMDTAQVVSKLNETWGEVDAVATDLTPIGEQVGSDI